MSQASELCDRVLRALWRHAPVNATYLGIHDHDHRLADYDPDALQARRKELGGFLREVELLLSGPEDSIDAAGRLDLDLVARELRVLLRSDQELRLPFRSPGGYLDDAAFGVYILMMRRFAPAEERARAVASRLAAVPRFLEQARRNLHRAEEIPPLWASMSIELAASTASFFGQAADWARVEAPAVIEEVENSARQARQAVAGYERFLAEEVRPRAAGRFAVGRDMFEFLLRESHGLSDSAADLEAFGRREIERTLERLQEAAGSEGGSWESQVEACRRDSPGGGSLLAAYREEVDRSRRFVIERDLIGFPTGETLEVVETPVFERRTTPFAAYVPPAPFEPDQRGYFWVTPPDGSRTEAERVAQLQEHMRPAIPITCIHEGYPGHHLQISLANRVASGPRRQIWTPVMVEGWALYCEEMMGEAGYYRDPRTRLLQLKDYLWRCCRVVIDIGLHTRDLPVAEAVRMLVEVVRMNPAGAEGEVRRYSRTPTQPLSYAVGKREILRLREEVRRREGERFTLRSFHDRLLQFGSIPPSLIRARLLSSPQA